MLVGGGHDLVAGVEAEPRQDEVAPVGRRRRQRDRVCGGADELRQPAADVLAQRERRLDEGPARPSVLEIPIDRGASLLDVVPLLRERRLVGLELGRVLLELRALRVEMGLERVQFLRARFEGGLRLLELRCRGFHRIEQERGGLLARHVRSPP